MSAPLVVAFDLDMTLIDSRPSVAAALRALADETGHAIDVESIVERLGPPITELLSESFGPHEMDAAVERYLDLYLELGVPLTRMLRGADRAVDAVRKSGGQVAVITAKSERTARPSLDHVGLSVDIVLGSCHGPEKQPALNALGAALYVGDTPPDMRAARGAGAYAVGVASGPFESGTLRNAGAHAVLRALDEFPSLFEEWRRRIPT